jgi:hypothetical protein
MIRQMALLGVVWCLGTVLVMALIAAHGAREKQLQERRRYQ